MPPMPELYDDIDFIQDNPIPIDQLPIVAHVDKMTFRVYWDQIGYARNYANFLRILAESVNRFINQNNRALRFRRHNFHPRPIGLTLVAPMSIVTVITHKHLNDFILENQRLPSVTELNNMGFGARWVATITITARRQPYYRYHLENIIELVTEFERWGLMLTPSTMEIAFDTVNETLGMFMRQKTIFRWAPSNLQLFHMDSSGRIPINAPTPDGNNEYHGYRPKTRNDTRDSIERPRGGSRQIYSYYKTFRTIGQRVLGFYRFELRLMRKHLAEVCKRRHITSGIQLIQNMEDIARQQIKFAKLDWERLLQEHPYVSTWGIEGCSTKGQLYYLEQSGLTRHEAMSYLREIPSPDIFFCIDPYEDIDRDNFGDALIRDLETLTNYARHEISVRDGMLSIPTRTPSILTPRQEKAVPLNNLTWKYFYLKSREYFYVRERSERTSRQVVEARDGFRVSVKCWESLYFGRPDFEDTNHSTTSSLSGSKEIACG